MNRSARSVVKKLSVAGYLHSENCINCVSQKLLLPRGLPRFGPGSDYKLRPRRSRSQTKHNQDSPAARRLFCACTMPTCVLLRQSRIRAPTNSPLRFTLRGLVRRCSFPVFSDRRGTAGRNTKAHKRVTAGNGRQR